MSTVGAAGDETKRNDELIRMRAGEGNEDEREEMPEVVIEATSPLQPPPPQLKKKIQSTQL